MVSSAATSVNTPRPREQKINTSVTYKLTGFQKEVMDRCFLNSGTENIFNLNTSGIIKYHFDHDLAVQSLRILFKRHEILRTNFIKKKGEVEQCVLPLDECKITIHYYNCQHYTPKHVYEKVNVISKQRFQIGAEMLLRVSLIETGEENTIVVFTTHRLIADQFSLSFLFKEFLDIYPVLSSGNHVIVKEDSLRMEKLINISNNLTSVYNAMPSSPFSNLMHSYNKTAQGYTPEMEEAYTKTSYAFKINAYFSEEIRIKAEEYKATTYMLMLAAFQLTLNVNADKQLPVCLPKSYRSAAESKSFGNLTFYHHLNQRINNKKTVAEIIAEIKTSISNPEFNTPDNYTLCTDLDSLSNSVAFSWEHEKISKLDEELLVIAKDKDGKIAALPVMQPFYIKKENCLFLLHMDIKMNKNGEMFGELKYDQNYFNEKEIENFYLMYYKLLLLLIDDKQYSLTVLKEMILADFSPSEDRNNFMQSTQQESFAMSEA